MVPRLFLPRAEVCFHRPGVCVDVCDAEGGAGDQTKRM